MEGRRLDFADCADCEAARDAVCEGIFSVCDLELFGPPFSATAAASVETACTFANACSRFEANVACFGQCTPEGVYFTSTSIISGFLGDGVSSGTFDNFFGGSDRSNALVFRTSLFARLRN